MTEVVVVSPLVKNREAVLVKLLYCAATSASFEYLQEICYQPVKLLSIPVILTREFLLIEPKGAHVKFFSVS